MALYHFHVDQIKRSAGQSVIAAAAYRAGEKLYSEYYGETNDYSRKGGILHTEILLQPNAPPEYKDRQTLWNAVEKVEKNKKAQLAYSFDIALQNELTMEENIALARRFVQEHLVSKGMIADLAVHEPDKENGISNPHFHVLTTMRPLNPDGTWGNKQRREYALDENGERIRDEKGEYVFNAVHTTDWGEPETLDHWREAWCQMVNAEFEQKGIATRIDHRSYEAQGIEQIPTVHEGPLVQKMEKRGIRTTKADLNRWIRTTNRLIAAVKKGIRTLLNWIAALKKEIEEAEKHEPYLIDLIGQYYLDRNRGAWSQKAKNQNTKRFFAAYSFLQENDLHTVEQLEERVHSLSKETNDLLARVNANSARVKKLQDMIIFGTNVRRIQPIIDKMNAIHWKGSREKFRAAHQGEIGLYYTSKRILKQNHGVTKVDIPAWQQEQNALREEEKVLSDEYKSLRERLQEMRNVQYCVEIAQRDESRDMLKRDRHLQR
ncbi:MAG: MobA/MobL family protein [Clostridia bacterium]|nr:MobA/MobL family protein [Clostridia bacterium]